MPKEMLILKWFGLNISLDYMQKVLGIKIITDIDKSPRPFVVGFICVLDIFYGECK